MRLLAFGPSPDEPDAFIMGLHLRLAQGWETYWRTPGDAGVPPEFYFDETENVDEVYVDWPLPERKVQGGMTTYVYRGDVLLPITVFPHERAQPIKLRIKVAYAVCREVCTLEEADLAMEAMADKRDAALAPLFEREMARVPILDNRPDIAIERVIATNDRRAVEVMVRADTPWVNPDVIIEAAAGFLFKPATATPSMNGQRYTLRAEYTHPSGLEIKPGETLLITVFDANRAIERMMTVAAPE